MIWEILRHLISFFLPTFYKRVEIKNIANIQVKGPVIIAMNHPNAFTDPIMFSYLYYPWKAFFLARGDAFKPGIISHLLESLKVVPIFRIQDGGKEGLKKNDESYERVNYLLQKGEKVIVFAEGLCIQERRLRPLKKGVARMVFGAYEALNRDDLVVVPVGVNYDQPDRFRSDVFYNVGEAIAVKDFIADYKENPARTYNKFLQVLEPKMRELITHIEDKENDEVVYFVETLCKENEVRSRGMKPGDLEHEFVVLKDLTEKVNTAAKTNKETLEAFRTAARSYFAEMKKQKLRDRLIDPLRNQTINYFTTSLRLFLLLLGSPLYLLSLIVNYPTLVLSHLLTKKIIKHIEFYSSFAIGIGMFLFWFTYILWFTIIYTFSANLLWPFLICIGFGLSGWFGIYYFPFAKKTFGMLRLLRNTTIRVKLAVERENLISLINKF